jgi:hypothetical protein
VEEYTLSGFSAQGLGVELQFSDILKWEKDGLAFQKEIYSGWQ